LVGKFCLQRDSDLLQEFFRTSGVPQWVFLVPANNGTWLAIK
jgi:hypothetical protein